VSAIDAPVFGTARVVTSRRRALASELVPIVDQPVSSASNFVLNTLVARVSTPASFAPFTLASTIYIVLQGVLRGGLLLPLLASPDHAHRHDAVPRLLRTVVLLATGVGLVSGIALVIGGTEAATLLCVALPVVLLQDAQRFAAFALRRDLDALLGDLMWLIGIVGLLAAWSALGAVLTPMIVVACWVGGAIVSVTLMGALQIVPGRRGAAVGSWTSTPGIAAGGCEFLVAAGVTYGAPLLAVAAYGTAGVSALRAALVFFAPCFALLPGLQTPVLRVLARAADHAQRRLQYLLGFVLALGVGVGLVRMYSARGWLGPLLLGGLWVSTAPVLAPMALFTLARFVELPAYSLGRVRGRNRMVLGVRSTTTGVIIVAFGGAMVSGQSLNVAAWVLAITSCVCATGAHVWNWGRA
jgi:hypothetical protein